MSPLSAAHSSRTAGAVGARRGERCHRAVGVHCDVAVAHPLLLPLPQRRTLWHLSDQRVVVVTPAAPPLGAHVRHVVPRPSGATPVANHCHQFVIRVGRLRATVRRLGCGCRPLPGARSQRAFVVNLRCTRSQRRGGRQWRAREVCEGSVICALSPISRAEALALGSAGGRGLRRP